jgi:hypothetical protein
MNLIIVKKKIQQSIKKVSKKLIKIIGKEGESKAKDFDSTEQKNL